MKYFTVLLVSLIVLLSNPSYLPLCNLRTARQDIPPRLFQLTTTDSPSQNPIITRFFHNKPGVFLNGTSKCYLNFFDPVIIAKNTLYFGIFGWLYAVYKMFLTKKWILIAAFFILPLIPYLIPFPQIIYLHKIFDIIGFGLIAKKFS